MEFKAVADARRSVRDYTDQPVKMEDLCEIVKTAGRAASWCNSQPWKVYAVMGDKLQAIRDAYAERLAAETPAKMEFGGVHREEMTEQAAANMGGFFGTVAPYRERGTMAPQVLYGAPVVLILMVSKDASQYAMYDLGAFGEQLMLAAQDRGISSLVAAMFVSYPDVLRHELPIEEDEAIAIVISLGYASEAEVNGIATSRMALDDYLTICE